MRLLIGALITVIIGAVPITGTPARGEGPPEVVSGHYIIYTKPPGRLVLQSESAQQLAKRRGANVQLIPPSYKKGVASVREGAFVVMMSDTQPTVSILADLAKHPEVYLIEPVYVATLFTTGPNDPFFDQQTYLNQTELIQFWGMKQSHDVVVAVVDTGVNLTHPDLANRVVFRHLDQPNGYDDDQNGIIDDTRGAAFTTSRPDRQPIDEHGHGTHISGIIAAEINNAMGVAGISRRAMILPIRVTNAMGQLNQVDAAMGILYAVEQGANIILCAWGYTMANQVLKDAIALAQSQGVLVIAAMGNSGTDVPEYPAALPGVVAVGAIGANRVPLHFSSTGSHISFVGYGAGMVGLGLGDTVQTLSGTSQAAAVVTGIAATLWGYNPNLSASDLKTIMIFSAETLLDQRNPVTGYGLLSPEKAFRHLNTSPLPPVFMPTVPVSSDSATPWWISVLLFPVTVVSGLFGWLF